MAQEIADSTLLDTWASSGLVVEPDISKIIEGWQLGEQPPHEYMNWLQNTFGSKLNHILKNGVASWNNETEYLAGSSVQHNGNVWLCKATNTNSEPADINANWKRIITVEALENLLAGYVATTGNQTIAGVKTFSSNPISTATQSTAVNALTRKDYVDGLNSANVKLTGDQTITGVKTFSSSPIVPTPTTGTQAVNKDYADLKVALASFIGTNQNLATSGYQKLPGGLIIQWSKKLSVGTTLNPTWTLPISFPNNVLLALSSDYSNIGGSSASSGVFAWDSDASTTSILQFRTLDTGATPTGHFFAIGY